MLESLFGNKTKEKVLLYLYVHQEGYAQEIRQKLGLSLLSVQLQLRQLEQSRVLVCRKRDRTIVYQINPQYPFYQELRALLERLLLSISPQVREKYYTPRLRPRRQGKPW